MKRHLVAKRKNVVNNRKSGNSSRQGTAGNSPMLEASLKQKTTKAS